jgi:hypothetical protein
VTVSWLIMSAPDLTIRLAGDDDLAAIVGVGTAALGWDPTEPNLELFGWKHVHNVFGPSPIWLAEADGVLAGYRSFMRWELTTGTGEVLRAVRAVDTATHPDFRRRGIFSNLTMHGVEAMTAEGVDLVFNTPNTQSRPGYLKLDWVDVGRLPLWIRPTGLGAVSRLRGARTAADKWSLPSDVGESAQAALDDDELPALLESQPLRSGLATRLDLDVLTWRYGTTLLGYRAWVPDGVAAGVVFHRLRGRGTARECAVGLVLAPDGDTRRRRELLATLAAAVDADYLAVLGSEVSLGDGFVPAPRQGPRLTARMLKTEPPAETSAWALGLGDIELF